MHDNGHFSNHLLWHDATKKSYKSLNLYSRYSCYLKDAKHDKKKNKKLLTKNELLQVALSLKVEVGRITLICKVALFSLNIATCFFQHRRNLRDLEQALNGMESSPL